MTVPLIHTLIDGSSKLYMLSYPRPSPRFDEKSAFFFPEGNAEIVGLRIDGSLHILDLPEARVIHFRFENIQSSHTGVTVR